MVSGWELEAGRCWDGVVADCGLDVSKRVKKEFISWIVVGEVGSDLLSVFCFSFLDSCLQVGSGSTVWVFVSRPQGVVDFFRSVLTWLFIKGF